MALRNINTAAEGEPVFLIGLNADGRIRKVPIDRADAELVALWGVGSAGNLRKMAVSPATAALVHVLGLDEDGRFRKASFPAAGATTFSGLTDTPADYTGQAGKLVAVNAGASGLVFVDMPGAGATTLIGLSDTPGAYTGAAGRALAVNAAGDGVEFVPFPAAGASAFTGLSDTPAAYTDQGGKLVAVNSGGTGLEFVSASKLQIAAIAANYTLTLADAGRYVRSTAAAAITVTVPTNAAVAFEIGSVLQIRQAGAGQVTVNGDTGVTVNAAETRKTRAVGSTLAIIKVAANEWDLTGDAEGA